MSQQNFTAQKVIYLSEILCVCMERSVFFSLSRVAVKLLPLLSKSFKADSLLAVLTRTGKDVARGNHTSSIKSWLESEAALSLWFLKVCPKSCII